MEFRNATKEDLPILKEMYIEIVEKIHKNGIMIWNSFYPFEEFENDIENKNMYLLCDKKTIVAGYALTESMEGEENFDWKEKSQKALYLCRLGVNVKYERMGIGSKMIRFAEQICKDKGIKYIRLTVVDFNIPAINFYLKNGFVKVNGNLQIDAINGKLNEYGFEKEVEIFNN